MDQHSPDFYREDTAAGLAAAAEVVKHVEQLACSRILPCVIPRFIPTCSEEMLRGLGQLCDAHPGGGLTQCARGCCPPTTNAAGAAHTPGLRVRSHTSEGTIVCGAGLSNKPLPRRLPPNHCPPGLRVHSHISESRDEVDFSLRLHPGEQLPMKGHEGVCLTCMVLHVHCPQPAKLLGFRIG